MRLGSGVSVFKWLTSRCFCVCTWGDSTRERLFFKKFRYFDRSYHTFWHPLASGWMVPVLIWNFRVLCFRSRETAFFSYALTEASIMVVSIVLVAVCLMCEMYCFSLASL